MESITESASRMQISSTPPSKSNSKIVRRKLTLRNGGVSLKEKKVTGLAVMEGKMGLRLRMEAKNKEGGAGTVIVEDHINQEECENVLLISKDDFVCPECDRKFKDKKKLSNHRRIRHEILESLRENSPKVSSCQPSHEGVACAEIDGVNDVVENSQENFEKGVSPEIPSNSMDVSRRSASVLQLIQDCEDMRDNAAHPTFQSPTLSSSSSFDSSEAEFTSNHNYIRALSVRRRVQFRVPAAAPSTLVPIVPQQMGNQNGEEGSTVPVVQLPCKPIILMQCSLCNMQFSTKGALTNHLECHEGKRPFLCPVCYWSYKTELQLLDHYCCKHSKEALFKCGGCVKKYKTHRGLNNHKILKQCKTPQPSTSSRSSSS